MPTPFSDELIEQYLAGDLPPDVADQVRAYLDATPGRRGVMAGIRASIRGEQFATSPVLDETLARFHAMVDQAESETRHGARMRPTWPRKLPWQMLVGISAALLLSWGILRGRFDRTTKVLQHYTTAPAQWSTVRLADGSTIILAPATSVTMTSRGAEIVGEAAFTIAQKPSDPFVVSTKNAVVQVLGTRFTVRQYPNESASRVVVDDGKVGLHTRNGARSNTQTVLTARMLAQVTDSGITVTPGISTREYMGWTNGSLVFKGVALRDVVTELARAYGVDINVADTALAKRPIVMEVSVQQNPLPKVLDLIGFTLDAHYTRAGQTYVLVPGRHTPRVPQRQRFLQPEKQYGR